jgi:hypothetical protein
MAVEGIEEIRQYAVQTLLDIQLEIAAMQGKLQMAAEKRAERK